MNTFKTINEDNDLDAIELGKNTSACVEKLPTGEILVSARFGKHEVTLTRKTLNYMKDRLREFEASLYDDF